MRDLSRPLSGLRATLRRQELWVAGYTNAHPGRGGLDGVAPDLSADTRVLADCPSPATITGVRYFDATHGPASSSTRCCPTRGLARSHRAAAVALEEEAARATALPGTRRASCTTAARTTTATAAAGTGRTTPSRASPTTSRGPTRTTSTRTTRGWAANRAQPDSDRAWASRTRWVITKSRARGPGGRGAVRSLRACPEPARSRLRSGSPCPS
jgi:hypothetical protein